MRTSFFSLSPLLLPRGPMKGLEAHYYAQKALGSQQNIWQGSNVYTTQGLWGFQYHKWHCQEEERPHLGRLRALWPSKSLSDSIKPGCCQSFSHVSGKICRCSLGRKEGGREFKMGNCCAVGAWEYLPHSSKLRTTDSSDPHHLQEPISHKNLKASTAWDKC